MPDDQTRLNKYLALHLGIARREADNLIERGRVRINHMPARLGQRIEPNDTVTVDDKPLTVDNSKLIYLALNKPIGFVCSRRAQAEGARTIYELLPPEYQHLKSVGRLDRDSSGLILLTNDGDFAHQMTHPSFTKTKIYEIQLDHQLEPLHQQMISDHGIQLDDGRSQLGLERMFDDSRYNWRVIMHEGRNRQIRRTFSALGYTVEKLHRINFGKYALGDIKPGEFQIINIQ